MSESEYDFWSPKIMNYSDHTVSTAEVIREECARVCWRDWLSELEPLLMLKPWFRLIDYEPLTMCAGIKSDSQTECSATFSRQGAETPKQATYRLRTEYKRSDWEYFSNLPYEYRWPT